MDLTLDQALQKGVEAHKAGNVQEADRYYTAILKANPKHPDANHNMGVLAVGVGKVQEALPFFKAALDANPGIAQFWLSYIDALIKLDRTTDAKAVFEQAKSTGAKGDRFDQIELRLDLSALESSKRQDPQKGQLQPLIALYSQGQYEKALRKALQLLLEFQNSVILYNIIGAANKKLGRLEKAMEAYNKAISIKPDYADTYNNMGLTLKAQGNLEEAIEAFKKALSIKPDYAEAYNNLGNAFHEQGKLDKAIQAFSKALSIKPDYAEAYNNMGNALKDQGKLEEAIKAYNKAISIKPNYPEAYNNMGVALKAQGKLEEAIKAYNKAISIKPDYAEVYNNMGNALKDLGKLEEAIKTYNKALSIKPDYADAYNNMGNALKGKGKLNEAIKAYNKAISIKPDFAEAHRNLSLIKKYTYDDKHFLQVQKVSKRKDLSGSDECQLSFALAKMYEDIGQVDQTFAHLSKGNALRRKLLKYSITQDRELFTKLKETQPGMKKNALEIKKDTIEPTPIFILGMPRSGTTLVEQIVSSHSEVIGAGELDYIELMGFKLATETTHISTLAVSEFREMYLSELTKLSNGKPFVTDKMPQNFQFISLICAALPEAKIIHVQRNASATCWSNYKQYFVSNSLGYCYDLRDVVAYYNLYKDLMKFWQSHYGDKIYNLDYEKLTNDQENEIGKLIERLDLTWEEACLSPHKNKRSVRTASQQQVRQKVYKGSSEAWRKYEPYLNGAFDGLPSL